MAIYKSSFNQKPEKPQKPKKEKVEKIKQPKQKQQKNIKINPYVVCLLMCLLVFVVCCFPSNFLKSFLLGIVGLSIYPLSLIGVFFAALALKKKKYNMPKKYVVYISVSVCIIWFVFHLILTSKIPLNSFGNYLKESYLAKTTAGGLIFSLISFPIVKILTYVGAYIFSAIALAIFVGLIVDYISVARNLNQTEKKVRFGFDSFDDMVFDEKPIETITPEEHTKKLAKRKLGLDKEETTIISSSMPNYRTMEPREPVKPMSKRDYILTPIEPVVPTTNTQDIFSRMPKKSYTYEKINKPQKSNFDNDSSQSVRTQSVNPVTNRNIEEIKPVKEIEKIQEEIEEKEKIIEPVYQEIEEVQDEFIVDDEDLSEYETAFETDMELEDEEEFEDLNEEVDQTEEDIEEEVIDADVEKQDYVDEYAVTQIDKSDLGSTVDTKVIRPSAVDLSKFNIPNVVKKPVQPEKPKGEERKRLEIPPYVAPPVELLNYMENVARISDEEIQDNIDRLEQVLEDFKVPAKVNNVQVGPAVTRYELTMPRGISVNKIAQMADDIAMTLASNGAIRVEAPIPGKNSVGIEVPNAQVSPVSLRELVDSEAFRQRGNPLSFVLGKDINGDIIFCNLDKMPHVLVAGSTGSGKSVCLNTMLLSMCYKAGPEDLRLILVDPKMVEFSTYNGLPHLLVPEVIIGKDLTINALDWSIKEMERRYALFAKNHVVNINEFNKLEIVKSKKEEKLPFIVIVVDELADLMLEAKREIEDRIAKLAAKARAAGIHLVLATQRPSVDVITGTVKANLPSRIAFALTNYMDSKTVLDGGGAEKLLGKGDMLFKPQDKPEPRRIQGAYVSNAEISAVVQYIKDHNNPVYDEDAGRSIKNPNADKTQNDVGNERDVEFDPVLKDALRMFIQVKQGSASMIQRRYSVGSSRAGRIIDQMEMAGFVGPMDGAKPRQVLITMEEFKAIFGED